MKNEITADEFKVGDKVYCAMYGEGAVKNIIKDDEVGVRFIGNNCYVYYTQAGVRISGSNRTLFFSEPKVEGSVKRPFVSKLVGKKVVVNTEYDLCVIGVVEIENSEYLTINDCHYAKEELKALYEVTSDNLL